MTRFKRKITEHKPCPVLYNQPWTLNQLTETDNGTDVLCLRHTPRISIVIINVSVVFSVAQLYELRSRHAPLGRLLTITKIRQN